MAAEGEDFEEADDDERVGGGGEEPAAAGVELVAEGGEDEPARDAGKMLPAASAQTGSRLSMSIRATDATPIAASKKTAAASPCVGRVDVKEVRDPPAGE